MNNTSRTTDDSAINKPEHINSSQQLEGVRVTSTLWSVIIIFAVLMLVLIIGGIYWLFVRQ